MFQAGPGDKVELDRACCKSRCSRERTG